ncbi:hypothetical protein GCM10022631_30070 [Deinococcus rubellus]|uniref:hypothetical protein n=1 Tax=Deinococcus rubellus TaxID=1889240 RepID=UPI0031EDF2D1
MRYGFYSCEPWTPATRAQVAANQLTDLARAAAAGATLLHFAHLQDVGHTRHLLNMARIWGIGIILEDLVEPDLSALISHPALLMLNVQDDANTQPLDVVTRKAAASQVLPRYLSMGPTEQNPRAEYYGLTEALGLQSYVFPGWLMGSYLVWSAARVQADKAHTYLIGNSQLHNAWKRAPTPVEVRAQTWVAAATGCDALLGYALRSSSGEITPDIFAAYVSACREVQNLPGRATCSVTGTQLTAQWPGLRVVIELSDKACVVSCGPK